MGYFSTYAGKMGCKVKTYEPVPGPLRFIKLNTMLNRLDSLVEIHPNAVDYKRGFINISINPDWGLSIVSASGNLQVETVTIADIVLEDLILLKIDVEGHEMKILSEMSEVLKKYKIENLVVETSQRLDSMRTFINNMTSDYLVLSYAEEYFTPNHWKNINDIRCQYVRKLEGEQWIPFQDLWYIRKESPTYKKIQPSLRCQ